MQKGTSSLIPTPFEVILAVGVAYFLWFLSGGAVGIAAGLGGVGAGVVLSRAAGLWKRNNVNLSALVWIFLIVGLVIAAPFLASGGFRVSQLTIAAYTAMIVLGLNLLTGFTGQISLGHTAFAGIGAYTVAIMISQWDTHILIAGGFAVVFAGLAGLLIGLPATRLSGPYLAIATVGLAVVFPQIVRLDEVSDYTQAHQGLSLFEYKFGPPVDWGWLTDERWYYFLAMVSLGVLTLLAHNLSKSAAGRAMRAVRDNELAAMTVGINMTSVKVSAFAISAAYAGLAGVFLFIVSNRFVQPDFFQLLISVEYLIGMVAGGIGSIPGAVIGGFFIIYFYHDGLETFSSQTEGGNDNWLFLIGLAVGLGLLFRNAWLKRQTTRYAERLHSRYGGFAVAIAKVAVSTAMAIGFVWLFRQSMEGLFTLRNLRGAITGASLIMLVLFAPRGLAGIISDLQTLTWPRIFEWIRSTPFVLPFLDGGMEVEALESEAAPVPRRLSEADGEG